MGLAEAVAASKREISGISEGCASGNNSVSGATDFVKAMACSTADRMESASNRFVVARAVF